VTLAPGQSQTVEFILDPTTFGIWDQHMRHVVEPGVFDIMSGADSANLKTVTLNVIS
jgi:beta-glucosidase